MQTRKKIVDSAYNDDLPEIIQTCWKNREPLKGWNTKCRTTDTIVCKNCKCRPWHEHTH